MERFNQWLGVMANVGVVAGIIFLAIEFSRILSRWRNRNLTLWRLKEDYPDVSLGVGSNPAIQAMWLQRPSGQVWWNRMRNNLNAKYVAEVEALAAAAARGEDIGIHPSRLWFPDTSG